MLNILKNDLTGFSTINHSTKNINSVTNPKRMLNKENNSSSNSPNLY